MDIKSILAKKSWTGDEVGRAIILSLVHSYQDTLAGRPETTLFDGAQLKTMVGALKTKEHVTRYNRYVGLNNWISINQPIAMNMYQRAESELNKLTGILSTARAAEALYEYIERLPAIFTQKQYEERRAARLQALLAEGPGLDVFGLLRMALGYHLRRLERAPRQPNPLKAIRKRYRQQQLSSPLILARYNEVMNEGYHTLADGRRSDEMTEAAWREATTPPRMAEADVIPFANGLTLDEAIRDLVESAQATMDGSMDQHSGEALERRDIENGSLVPTTWHPYEQPPEGLTQWDIIASEDLDAFYSAALSGRPHTPEAYAEEARDFLASFPELAQALIADIDSRHCEGAPAIAGLPVEAWETTRFPLRSLHARDFYGFREAIERDASLFDDDGRACRNGIAILRPYDAFDPHGPYDPDDPGPNVDRETGHYVDPERTMRTLSSIGLTQFTPANKDWQACTQDLQHAHETIADAFYYVLGFDQAVDMIAAHIGIPDFAIFKLGTKSLRSRIEEVNGLVPVLYAQIEQTAYANAAAKAEKLDTLKAHFPPIRLEGLCIPQEAIAQAQGMLDDNLRAFEAQDGVFAGTLCIRREEA